MPREYLGNQQPRNLDEAESQWRREHEGLEPYYYEVRETREFTLEDI